MKKHGKAVSVIPGVTVETKLTGGVRARYQVAGCSDCGHKLWLRNTTKTALPEEVIFKKLRQHGWRPHKKGKHLCTKCLAATDTTTPAKETIQMPKDTANVSRNHEMTEPLFLRELIELLGQKKAAAELHLSEPGITDMLARGKCRYVTEMAAELLVSRLMDKEAPSEPEAPKPALVVASVKREDLDVVQRILGGLGVALSEIEVPV